MKNLIAVVLVLILHTNLSAQLVINELDCDTPGIDNMEFIELLSDTPNFGLDGYVIVLFNGSSSGVNSSYFTLDLDGYVTDNNGLLLIGSSTVSPVPQLLISENVIQNGADAVAIYQGSDFNFPEETVATIDKLIDVLMYGTSDADDIDMLDIFRAHPDFTDLQQINEGSGNNTNSIQRNNDGTYTSTTPTPRRLNDGTGEVLNGIRIEVGQDQYSEGDIFDVSFTTEENVTEDLSININLNNFLFDNSDYTGNTSLTILAGENSVRTTITLVDDAVDEGDEVAIIQFINLPTQLLALNNNIPIRIVDNDFRVASFGAPTNPTYDVVASSQPNGYYTSVDGLSSDDLRDNLRAIIANPAVVRAQTYTDIIDILEEADQNPSNSNQVWLVYTEEGRAKLDFQTTGDNNGKWNREHTFPRSRGGYSSIEEDENADGIDIFWPTSADSLRHGNSDAHALRAADGRENGMRSNQHYGEYNGPTGNLGSFKGDVARSVLYMEIRYNGLEIVNGFPDVDGQLGDLATLLDWHRNDPPDDFEMNRNNVIYTWQRNRNPFIDQPDLIEYIWGDKVGEIWNQPVAVRDIEQLDVSIYPNPTSGRIYVDGLNMQQEARAEVYTVDGKLIHSILFSDQLMINLDLASGMYWIRVMSEGKVKMEKVVVGRR